MTRDDDRGERRRVAAKVSQAVEAFFRLYGIDGKFHGEDLEDYVDACGIKCRAESVQRIMRDLRQEGAINYRCRSRAESLYQILPLEPVGPVQQVML